MILIGKIVKKKWAEGSKSEHEAVCIETKTQTLKLRRQGGNPSSDPELEKWVGQDNIQVEGETGPPNIFWLERVEPSDVGMAREIMRTAFQEIKALGIKAELDFGCKISHVSDPSEKDFVFYVIEK